MIGRLQMTWTRMGPHHDCAVENAPVDVDVETPEVWLCRFTNTSSRVGTLRCTLAITFLSNPNI